MDQSGWSEVFGEKVEKINVHSFCGKQVTSVCLSACDFFIKHYSLLFYLKRNRGSVYVLIRFSYEEGVKDFTTDANSCAALS